jgi:hypothetical protein
MNANDDTINLIWDRAAYQVDPFPASRELVCQVSPGYLDTGHYRDNVHLSASISLLLLSESYLRQKRFVG